MSELEKYLLLAENDYEKARNIKKSSMFWFDFLEKYPDFKEEASLNKHLPDEILRLLAEDNNNNIRLTIAMKRRLPADVFELLSSDENESVRLAIARNPKASCEILQRMKDDSWDEIRDVVLARLINCK